MYHPGKVIEVFSKSKNVHSSDSTTQAMLEMWDENLITVLVEKKLNKQMKKQDVVLVDYRPMNDKPVPRLIVVKVLKGKTATDTWKTYKDHHKNKKSSPTPQMPAQIPTQNVNVQHNPEAYVG
jgi:hypothetical protein